MGLLTKIRSTMGERISFHCQSIKHDPFVVKYFALGHLEIRVVVVGFDESEQTPTPPNLGK